MPAKKKAAKVIGSFAGNSRHSFDITVGRDAELKAKLLDQTRGKKTGSHLRLDEPDAAINVEQFHLVIGKAGGAAVQEACGVLSHDCKSGRSGQEEGNARLITECGHWSRRGTESRVPELIKELLPQGAPFGRNGGAIWPKSAGRTRPAPGGIDPVRMRSV